MINFPTTVLWDGVFPPLNSKSLQPLKHRSGHFALQRGAGAWEASITGFHPSRSQQKESFSIVLSATVHQRCCCFKMLVLLFCRYSVAKRSGDDCH